jgi:DNA polymerase-1
MDKTKPHLIIMDGDVLAFIAAAAAQHTVMDIENGNFTQFTDGKQATAILDGLVQKYRIAFASAKPEDDAIFILLSDPKENWRYDVYRNYKGNRRDTEVPMALHALKDHLAATYGATAAHRCEADDLASLMMTDPAVFPEGEKILVGRDKDFKSIPGWQYTIPHKISDDPYPTANYVTPEDADRWHMIQTLGGDMTDGFPGCPGIGYKRAAEIVDAALVLIPEEGTITRGPNKGKRTIKWMPKPAERLWDVIVSHYEKHGQTEMDALVTARLARLLRVGEYMQGEVTLWRPDFPSAFHPNGVR